MVFLIVFLLWLAAPLAAAEFTGLCVGVADGDTLTVMHDGHPEKVRLCGIDCPEKKQAFGQKAKQLASDLVFSREVTVVTHGRDRYGRTLGEVFLPNASQTLNYALVESGLAWHYTKYSNDPHLAGIEARARAANVGLWADPHNQPPWEFRHKQP